MPQLAACTAPSRASAPAASCRWPWRSSATSCRRVSGPSTRATSWPCSARRASSGPVVGGFFAGQDTILGITGWRWVFLVNVPIGHRGAHRRHPHAAPACTRAATTASTTGGAVALTVGLVPLLIVAEQGREWGWGSASALLCYGIGVVGLVAFFVVERAMGEEALIPLRLFRNRTVGVVLDRLGRSSAWACSAARRAAAVPADRQGRDADQAGLQLLPMTLGHHGRLDHVGPADLPHRPLPAVPHHRLRSCSSPSLLRASTTSGPTPRCGRPMIVMVFFGLGLGFNMQPLTLAVQNAVPPARHRRGHLVGDVHPADRRHAGRRRLPVDPVLRGAGPTSRRPSPRSPRPRSSRRR